MTLATPSLPLVPLASLTLSRLIIGGNPFRGYSHQGPALDREMRDYYTRDRVVDALLEAQSHGINAMIMRADRIIMDIVAEYRRRGGTMQWIAQTATEWGDMVDNIRETMKYKPAAIYLHGTEVDRRWRAGQMQHQRDLLKVIRDHGIPAGFATHIPEVHRYVRDNHWEVDFHMCCFYNIAKVQRQSVLAGGAHVEEPFDDPDRDIICQFIRETPTPCIAYKILAAGRKCATPADVRTAFTWALGHVTPTTPLCVGMFQKHTNQIAENCQLLRELTA